VSSTNLPPGQSEDNYPLITRLEAVTFGRTNPGLPVYDRLNELENAVFRQTFQAESLFDRTQRLKETLIGQTEIESQPMPQAYVPAPYTPYLRTGPQAAGTAIDPDQALWRQPIYMKELSVAALEEFALELINEDRRNLGLPTFQKDEIASKVASEHLEHLVSCNQISHIGAAGHNPDQRYTKAGGQDAMQESLIVVKNSEFIKPNRAAVAHIMKTLKMRQDDREALLSPYATHFAFKLAWSREADRLLACTEVVTRQGQMEPLPAEIEVGDRVDVKGSVFAPYLFDRVTLSWEGLPEKPLDIEAEARATDFDEEAMPYFPPLDFIAYARKSDNNNDALMAALRTAGVLAAIAGGVFVPPVALAAPLIAMSGSVSEPKPYSDIPVRGGVKVRGPSFRRDIQISNKKQEGLYYVTVWAMEGENTRPFPISRRTIVARAKSH